MSYNPYDNDFDELGSGHYDDDYDDYNEDDYFDDDDDYQPISPKVLAACDYGWRWRLKIRWYRITNRLDDVRRWLKWHNCKCRFCDKPALIDGVSCPDHYIPF